MPSKGGKQATHVVGSVNPDPNRKKIEYEERRDRLRKELEKRRAKSTDDPKDNPKKNPATENSKK